MQGFAFDYPYILHLPRFCEKDSDIFISSTRNIVFCIDRRSYGLWYCALWYIICKRYWSITLTAVFLQEIHFSIFRMNHHQFCVRIVITYCHPGGGAFSQLLSGGWCPCFFVCCCCCGGGGSGSGSSSGGGGWRWIYA